MESALYFGSVRHRRFAPRAHRLAYPLFQLFADLDRLDSLFAGSWLASVRRPAWARLRRRDHFGDPERSWSAVVRETVERELDFRPDGSVHLLTHPRTLGFRMNPVSFFFCSSADGAPAAIVAEVTNTPWDERHLYVLDARDARYAPAAQDAGSAPARDGGVEVARSRIVDRSFPKRFHVSPFFPMALDYRWRLTWPGERLGVHIESFERGAKQFDATLSLSRRPLTPANLRLALVGYPLLTFKVFTWIYLHAALLKLRGVPFHPHPKHHASPRPEPPEATASSSG